MTRRTTPARKGPFDVRKNGVPITQANLHGSVRTGITYTSVFAQFKALVNAGATVTELYQWYCGEWPPAFLAYLQVGTDAMALIEVHAQAEANKPKK